jgi:hypothetical protein
MRRIALLFLMLTPMMVWSQTSTPAQQQPPITVKVEMPPESIWTALLRLAIPTILGAGLGAGLTLYGVRLTNRHNAAENTENRQHQLVIEIRKAEIAARYKSQDNRWTFRKDLYVRLMASAIELTETYHTILDSRRSLRTTLTDEQRRVTQDKLDKAYSDFPLAVREFASSVFLAPIATADTIWRQAFQTEIVPIAAQNDPQYDAALNGQINVLSGLLIQIQNAARKDLWDIPDPAAEPNVATAVTA